MISQKLNIIQDLIQHSKHTYLILILFLELIEKALQK